MSDTSQKIKEKSFISTSEKPSANLALEWFATRGYPRRANNEVIPLINGQTAFAAVAAAIKAAKKSVDIVSWGFDASMRFERPGGDRIGELLKKKGLEGKKVRLLIWRNKLVQAMENTVPGANSYPGQDAKDLGLSGANRLSGPDKTTSAKLDDLRKQKQAASAKLFQLQTQRNSLLQSQWMNPNGAQAAKQVNAEYEPKIAAAQAELAQLETQIRAEEALMHDKPVGYGTSAPSKVTNSAGAPGDPPAARFNRDWHHEAQRGGLKNIEFRTRDFNAWDRSSIAYRQLAESSDKSPAVQLALLAAFPSHHQKMVLVDYEEPDSAVGFVMGHNMHNNYWDTSEHHYDDSMGLRIPGFGPWQDLSTLVRGSVLYDMNTNFVKAWDKGSPWYERWFDSLKSEREQLKPKHFATAPGKMRSVAQICRTQPQDGGEQSIKELYMLAAGNARKYIYVENQYFRFQPWAEKLKKTRKALLAGGKSEQTHGMCHLFVVTNIPDNSGRMNTYRMLKSLGKSNDMPAVEKAVDPPSDPNEIVVTAVAGLQIHICTLVSNTQQSTGNHYRPIYVHSKLLVVDDVFFTVGSANINTRSMEVDSELNIGCNDPAKARIWREKLFAMHTGSAPNDDPAVEFEKWADILEKNSDRQSKGEPLIGKLVEFLDNGGPATVMDEPCRSL
jgi:phosphatidylserine/phosphatidylglycerophosphate/cardiolipin synthase-like enzyme